MFAAVIALNAYSGATTVCKHVLYVMAFEQHIWQESEGDGWIDIFVYSEV